MKKSIFIIICLILIFCGTVFSQEFAKVGTAGAQFLKIGVDARAVAMSEAYSAICNDASAIFWNPSGLAFIENTSAIVSHAEWLADINFNAAAIAKTFSFGIQPLHTISYY